MYTVTVRGRSLMFETAPGVFAEGGPDKGTSLLLDAVLPHVKAHQRVLDLGCGVGLLGITLASTLSRGEAWLVDSDVRATRLAEHNVAINHVHNTHVALGDATKDLPKGLRFDLIVSNPPTHDGREVLRQFIEGSHHVLRPGGSLWVVVNRLLSMKDLMRATFGQVAVEARSKGYIVLQSQRSRTRDLGRGPRSAAASRSMSRTEPEEILS